MRYFISLHTSFWGIQIQVCIWCVLCFVCVGVCGRVKQVHSDEGCDKTTVTRLKLPHAGASLFVYVFCGRVNVCACGCLTQQAARVNQHALLCCHLLYKKKHQNLLRKWWLSHTQPHTHTSPPPDMLTRAQNQKFKQEIHSLFSQRLSTTFMLQLRFTWLP